MPAPALPTTARPTTARPTTTRPTTTRRTTFRRTALAVAAAAAVVAVAACGAAPSPTAPVRVDAPAGAQLATAVTEGGAYDHLRALARIADENGGNRASPSPGYDASVDYVARVLRDDGYDVTTPTYTDHDSDVPIRNVIARSRTGDPGTVVVAGAHLDSVPEGPGIVDNGSGVAALLEVARALGPSAPVRNQVVFAFFGSEENGSVGSTGWLDGLSSTERRALALYLNIDMVASPNAGYFVQGGHGDGESETGPAGSERVAAVLADQLARTGVTPEAIAFVGDDEAPFVEAGIPSAGAENGDAKSKTAAQATTWGGTADAPYDPCYHAACDGLGNVDRVVLEHYLRAIAGTVAHFATTPTDDLSR